MTTAGIFCRPPVGHLRPPAFTDIGSRADEVRLPAEHDAESGEDIGGLATVFGDQVGFHRRFSRDKNLPHFLFDHLFVFAANHIQRVHPGNLFGRAAGGSLEVLVPTEKSSLLIKDIKNARETVDGRIRENLLMQDIGFDLLAKGDVPDKDLQPGGLSSIIPDQVGLQFHRQSPPRPGGDTPSHKCRNSPGGAPVRQ